MPEGEGYYDAGEGYYDYDGNGKEENKPKPTIDDTCIKDDTNKLNETLNNVEFIGLMPKFMEAVGMTIGISDKSSKLFEFYPCGGDSLETVDTVEIMSQESHDKEEEEVAPKPGPSEGGGNSEDGGR